MGLMDKFKNVIEDAHNESRRKAEKRREIQAEFKTSMDVPAVPASRLPIIPTTGDVLEGSGAFSANLRMRVASYKDGKVTAHQIKKNGKAAATPFKAKVISGPNNTYSVKYAGVTYNLVESVGAQMSQANLAAEQVALQQQQIEQMQTMIDELQKGQSDK